MDLDVRDFTWWERKARIESARKRIIALGTARLAAYGEDSYERQVRDLADQIELWERPVGPPLTDDEIIANWKGRIAELRKAMAKLKMKKK